MWMAIKNRAAADEQTAFNSTTNKQNIRYAEIQFFKCTKRDVRISSWYLYASILKISECTHTPCEQAEKLASGTCYTCSVREQTID